MTRDEVAEKLRGFLQSKAPGFQKLTDTTLLREEWRLSSLGILETVSFIDDEFDVQMTQVDTSPKNFTNVLTLADFVLSRMKK